MIKKTALFMVGMSALSAVAGAATEAVASQGGAVAVSANMYYSWSVVAAAFGLALAAMAGAIGQGMAVSKAVEGIARQPEAANDIRGSLLLGLALIESLVIYALVVALILIFVNPFAALVVK
jgi:F-type H+-transporting ATPase subunit c